MTIKTSNRSECQNWKFYRKLEHGLDTSWFNRISIESRCQNIAKLIIGIYLIETVLLFDNVPFLQHDELTTTISQDQSFIFIRLTVLREYLQKELKMTNLPFEHDFEVCHLVAV